MKATHIIVQLLSRKSEQLFRASDGMLLAVRGTNMVQSGENQKTSEQRLFIDDESAARYLRTIAHNDWAGDGNRPIRPARGWETSALNIEVRDGESRIDLAQSMPGDLRKN